MEGTRSLNHPLEREGFPFGVKRYNPELERWEEFTWHLAAWYPVRLLEKSALHYEVSYDDTWAEPIFSNEPIF